MFRYRQIALGLLLILMATVAVAQPATTDTTTPTTTATTTAPTIQLSTIDAAQTRQELRDLLRRHPPEVAQVIELSPALLRNEAFLDSYPALETMVAQHPEIVHNAEYYFRGFARDPEATASTPTLRFWENFLGGLAAITIFVVATGTLVWLIKTILDQRRWNRQASLQADAHGKLLDRMASNEQLLTYIQTPAGRRFLESAPIPIDEPRPMSAPLGRVLWSIQAGLVLGAAGIGFLIVSSRVPKGGDLPMYVIGVVTFAIGLGFVASAAASFLLTRRLGLWQEPPQPPVEATAE